MALRLQNENQEVDGCRSGSTASGAGLGRPEEATRRPSIYSSTSGVVFMSNVLPKCDSERISALSRANGQSRRVMTPMRPVPAVVGHADASRVGRAKSGVPE